MGLPPFIAGGGANFFTTGFDGFFISIRSSCSSCNYVFSSLTSLGNYCVCYRISSFWIGSFTGCAFSGIYDAFTGSGRV